MMLNVIHHQETAILNNEIPLCTYENGQNPLTLRIPTADKGVEQQELFIKGWWESTRLELVGKQNGLAVPYTTTCTLTLWSSNWAPWELPRWVKNLHLRINLHVGIYNNFIYSCQNLEIAKMSFRVWVNKLCYIQTVEYYSTVRRNELSDHGNPWRKHKCILLSERSQSKKATYCVTLIIQYFRKVKTTETGRISDW